MSMRIVALAQKLRRSRQGAVAIMMGFMLVVMIGISALGVEMGFAYYKQRQMQSAADAAALGAGIAIGKGYPADVALQARALTAAVGYVDGADDVTVTVNRPPATGAHAADPNAVEVLVSQPQTLSLVTLFRSGLFTIRVRAVSIQTNTGSFCVLGLDTAASGAVRIKNNGVVSSIDCGVGVNSSSNTALILNNNARIDGPVSVVGNWSLANGAALTYETPPYPRHNASALQDPYQTVALPGALGPLQFQPPCPLTICPTLQPGHYLLGLNYSGKTLNLNQGVYYIDTKLQLSNNVTVNATGGVTIVINGNYAMNIGNNVTFNITAPANGPTAGLAFASIRTATSTVTQKFANNVILNLNGAIYFPNQIVQFDNNATITSGACGQVIARVVELQNNANLKNQCSHPIKSGGATQLVE